MVALGEFVIEEIPFPRRRLADCCEAFGLPLPRGHSALDILVVADPHTRSGKARAARRYGVRIMAEAAFGRAIGLQVE